MLQVGPSLRGRSGGPAERSAAVPERVSAPARLAPASFFSPYHHHFGFLAAVSFGLALALSPTLIFRGSSRLDTLYLSISTLDSLAYYEYTFHAHSCR